MENINSITYKVIEACIEVHKELGPGLLESVYEICLCKELINRNLKIAVQKEIVVIYKGEALQKSFYLDILVEDRLALELKAVDYILPVHEAQLITYLKLANIDDGLLINFNTALVKNGIKRLFRNYER